MNCVLFAEWRRVQCFGHRLNLAVNKALKKEIDSGTLGTTIKDVKKIVTHFAHSHKKRRALKEAQVSIGLVMEGHRKGDTGDRSVPLCQWGTYYFLLVPLAETRGVVA